MGGLEEQSFIYMNFKGIQRDLEEPCFCHGSDTSNLVLDLSPNYYKTDFGFSRDANTSFALVWP